jgi:hypothetical protein
VQGARSAEPPARRAPAEGSRPPESANGQTPGSAALEAPAPAAEAEPEPEAAPEGERQEAPRRLELTYETRRALRQAVSAARREQVVAGLRRAGNPGACTGCDGPLEETKAGCRACADRARSRRNRARPRLAPRAARRTTPITSSSSRRGRHGPSGTADGRQRTASQTTTRGLPGCRPVGLWARRANV